MASDLAYQIYLGERHHLGSEMMMVESLYIWETKPEEWVVNLVTLEIDYQMQQQMHFQDGWLLIKLDIGHQECYTLPHNKH